jgi:hypothetical protein
MRRPGSGDGSDSGDFRTEVHATVPDIASDGRGRLMVVSDNLLAIEIPALLGPFAGGTGCRRRSTTRCRPPPARHGARPAAGTPRTGPRRDRRCPAADRSPARTPSVRRRRIGANRRLTVNFGGAPRLPGPESAPSGASPSISARPSTPGGRGPGPIPRAARLVATASGPGRAAPGCDGRSVRGRAACRRSPTPRGRGFPT